VAICPEVLDKIGNVIRARIKLQGTVMALTAEGRLSGIVLMALPPVCLIAMLFMNPDYGMMLFNDPMGKMLLAIAGTMQTMGWLMIQKIINIKV
jgi:tight adherence protein B